MSDDIKVSIVRRGDRTNYTLQYRDPVTGKRYSRSAGTPREREAMRAASEWEAELRASSRKPSPKMGWQSLVDLYDETKLGEVRKGTRKKAMTTLTAFKAAASPRLASHLTSDTVRTFVAALRKKGRTPATVASHLRHLKAFARWAYQEGCLSELPRIEPSSRGSRMKGRPITTEEFERMLAAVPKVVAVELADDDAAADADPRVLSWRFALRLLWWSGLRISEAVALQWAPTPGGCWVILDGKRSVLAFDGESQKSGKTELAPLAPEAVELLEQVRRQSGRVLELIGGTNRRVNVSVPASRTIALIGAAAKVRVSDSGKSASAHDLRRAFGHRWSRRVMPAALKELMRHSSIETTMTFYVGANAKQTSAELWDAMPARGATLAPVDDSTASKPADRGE